MPTRQGWQMEKCGLSPPAPTEEEEVELPCPASFCAWYKVVVLFQQGDSIGSTSLGSHSAWKQTSWVHWNGDKSTEQTSLSSQPVPGQRHMHVAKSFPPAQHGPRSSTDGGQKQGWLHWVFSSSCSHPAALLPPSVMTFPLLSHGESQICLQSLLGGFARPSAKHHRPKG